MSTLYNQLQGVLPLLRDIVQPGTVEEGAARDAPGASRSADAGPRSRFEKRGQESWAVLDSRKGDALLALTKYKKGAAALIARLEAYERYIAHLAVIHVHGVAVGEARLEVVSCGAGDTVLLLPAGSHHRGFDGDGELGHAPRRLVGRRHRAPPRGPGVG